MAQQDGGVAVLGRGWKQTRDLASLSQVSVVRTAAEEHDERESRGVTPTHRPCPAERGLHAVDVALKVSRANRKREILAN